jgi:hypothetical protein
MRTWARGLRTTRTRTVLEYHVERWTSGFWAVPPRRAISVAVAAAGRELHPLDGETWGSKLRRTRKALRDAGRRKKEHDAELSNRSQSG